MATQVTRTRHEIKTKETHATAFSLRLSRPFQRRPALRRAEPWASPSNCGRPGLRALRWRWGRPRACSSWHRPFLHPQIGPLWSHCFPPFSLLHPVWFTVIYSRLPAATNQIQQGAETRMKSQGVRLNVTTEERRWQGLLQRHGSATINQSYVAEIEAVCT